MHAIAVHFKVTFDEKHPDHLADRARANNKLITTCHGIHKSFLEFFEQTDSYCYYCARYTGQSTYLSPYIIHALQQDATTSFRTGLQHGREIMEMSAGFLYLLI